MRTQDDNSDWDNTLQDGLEDAPWEPDLYSSIEQAIIDWEIDGTKTAGELTREILNIIKKQIQ